MRAQSETKTKMEKVEEKKKKKEASIVEAIDKKALNVELKLGKIRPRGRIFEGIVKKKLSKRVAIEFERMVYNRKYERYSKSKTKIHARLSDVIQKQINVGDLIKVQECRPLSKIIHFVVIDKIKSKEELK